MLQCTISPRILNQLGHGHKFYFYLVKVQSIIRNYQIKNPYVQFQMLQCTISPRILNQLGHEHELILSGQRSIH
jgi:hypothetical protein